MSKIYTKRVTPEVNEWKIYDGEYPDQPSFIKLVIHDHDVRIAKYGLQIKFAKDLVDDPDKDILQDNKSLAHHRVVADVVGPNTCRELSKVFAEAADELDRRNNG